MKKIFTTLVFLCTLVGAIQALPLNGVYTVNLGAPTLGNNFTDLDDALDSLQVNGISGPVTFILSQNIYTCSKPITYIIGTSATNTITIKGASQSTMPTLVNLSSGWSDNFIFNLNGAENYIFKNLIFTPGCPNGGSGAATYTTSIAINGYNQMPIAATNITIDSCVFNGKTDPDYGNETDNIHCFGSAVNNFTVKNSTFNNGAIGIILYPFWPSKNENILIENNTFNLITNGWTEGAIIVNDVQDITVRNNTIIGNFSEGIGIQNTTGGILNISRNKIFNTGYQAIRVQSNFVPQAMVANNMLANVATGIKLMFIADTLLLYNNSVSSNNWALHSDNGPNYVDSRNNIFSGINGNAILNVDSVFINSDYNLYNAPNATTLGTWGNNTINNITDLQSANGWDANSFIANPSFLSLNDLHISALSAAVDAGTNLPIITADIDGNARGIAGNLYDIGADETSNSQGFSAIVLNIGNTNICAGDTTKLIARPNGAGYIFNWLLNGISIPNAIDSFLYVSNTSGNYTCVVSQSNFSDTANLITMNVQSLPVADAGFDKNICSGGSITIGGNPTGSGGGGILLYNWIGTNINNNTLTNPTVNPISNSIYIVQVASSLGCISSDTMIVTVLSSPSHSIVVGADTLVCAGVIVPLTASVVGASNNISVSWSPSLGITNPLVLNTTATVFASTIYTVSVTDMNTGCIASNSINVGTSAPVINAGNDVFICESNCIPLLATGASTYSWSPNNGLNATNIANPMACPNSTIKYIVQGTDSIGCTAIDSVTVNVLALPSLSIFANGVLNQHATISNCGQEDITININGANTYSWTPANIISNISFDSILFLGNAAPLGSVTLHVLANASNGCSSIDSITILNLANPQVIVNKDTNVCPGQAVTLTAVIPNLIYTWIPTIIQPVGNSMTFVPNGATTVVLQGQDLNGCLGYDTANIQILPLANAQFTVNVNNDTMLSTNNSSSNAQQYVWQWGDNSANSNLINDTHDYNEGTYTITLIASNECGSDTAVQDISIVIIGIDVINSNADLQIWPNPSSQNVFLNSNKLIQNISIMDVTGRMVFNQNNINANALPISVYALATGLYHIVVEHSDKTKSKVTFVKQ